MRVILLLCLPFIVSLSYSQVTSIASGDWNDTNTWSCSCVPDFSESTITISANHTVSIPSGFTADTDQVVVGESGTLNILNGGTLIVRDGPGDDLTVTIGDLFFTFDGFLNVNSGGTLENRGQVVTSNTNTDIIGTYRHNLNGGIIPEAIWNTGSTLEVIGVTTTAPSGFGQTFYNVVWNCTHLSSISLLAQLLNVINDFTVSSTGTPPLIFSTNTTATLNIGGNLTVQNSSSLGIAPFAPLFTVNIAGDLTINSSISNSFIITSTGDPVVVNVQGNFSKSNTGNINFTSGTGTGTLNVVGNFSATAGSFNKSGSGSGNLNFNGTGIQVYTGGATFSNTLINFNVNSGSTLDLGIYQLGSIGGTGTFTNNGTIRVGSLSGTDAIVGNIPLPNRIFNPASTIIYNGAGPQFMGTAQPSSSGVSTVINNANGVSLATSVTIGGNLTLTSGNLSIGSNTLILGGTITPNTNSIATIPSSNISIIGAGPFGTLPLSGSTTINNFSINRTPGGTVTLGSDLKIDGTFTQTAGRLILNGNDLTISGPYLASSGDIESSATSALIIEDNGALPTSINISGGAMETFTLDRPLSTLVVPSTFTVTNLNLLQGTYNNTGGGITMATGGTITRSVGSMTAEPGAVSSYNVVYEGSTNMATGVELSPSDATKLNNLTILGSGIDTLKSNITINGDLTLAGASFIASNRTIILRGNFTSGSPGSFATSTLIFDGSSTIQGTSLPSLGHLMVNDGASLTFPSGTINIRGNVVLSSGSTIVHNNGTLLFNSGNSQSLDGGGKMLNNITINKTGGNLTLNSQVNVIGIVRVLSATTLLSGGHLVLVSTSDGATGTASIGQLAPGASIAGNVTVQRYMSEEGNIYRYISSPVAKLPVSQLQDDFFVTGSFTGASTCSICSTSPSMYWWDETTSAYSAYPVSSNSDTLTMGLGYAAYIRDNQLPGPVVIDFTGVVYQGDVSLPLTYTPGGIDFNLVGNPYPSAIDWENITDRINIAVPIAVRDNGSGGTFQYWDGGVASSDIPGGRIALGQAFWVRTTGASPALDLTESAKSDINGIFYREEKEVEHVFKVILAKGNVVDRAVVRLRQGATVELDDYDAPKLNNESFDISTLTPGGISMAINATNEMVCDAINLKIADMAQGTYTMSVETFGIFLNTGATLVDNFTNTQHDFKTSPQYQFSVTSNAASSATNRFSILLDQPDINPSAISTSLADAACNGDQYQVQLDNAQAGVYYFAELDGQVLGDSVLSNGSDPVLLNIAASRLAVGSNSVVLKGYNYCETLPLTNAVEIKHDKLYAASATNASRCLEGIVDLEAQGAPLDGSYNWYEAEDSATPIAGQHGNIFTTPSLVKTSSYFVSVVNSLGCEGARTPVVAEVKHYDDVTISENSPGSLTSSYDEGNQWYFNDTLIEGATGQSYSPEESGSYRVDVTTQGCVTSAAMEFVVTGVESTNPKSGISVYPTPTKDILYVRSAPGVKVNGISIFDNLGAKVGDLTLIETEKGKEGTFDMSHSADGIYFVKALVDQRTITIKVVKK